MKRKIIKNLLIFTVLIGINIFVTLKFVGKAQKTAAMNTVFDEITNSSLAGLPNSEVKQAGKEDIRIANLKAFFRKYGSPLYDNAETIVTASDKYQLDYRLIPAIAMQESTLCKFIPKDSHNCW